MSRAFDEYGFPWGDPKSLARPSRSAAGYVYFIQADGDHDHVKIGSASDPDARLRDLQCAHVRELRIVAVLKTDNVRRSEVALHRRFAHLRVRGEWFRVDTALSRYIESIATERAD